ncbi:DUF6443 domain-containing protein [Chryseobacterium sp. Marseille-Q8038]
MKKIIIPISALFITGTLQAQLTTLPNTENYIQTKTYLDYTGTSVTKSSETVQYFDGLGRPKQIVNVKASPLGKDVVTPIEYDPFGRQVKDYLPVPQGGTLNGAITLNPLSNLSSSPYGNEKIYSEKELEKSPLDRILEQKQVGNDWNGKSIKFGYEVNSTEDKVKKFTVTSTWVNDATESGISNSGMYDGTKLYKNIVTDEDENKTIEFKNGKGQTILIRKVISVTENADTYYVYNEYDQLAFVIPPLLSGLASWGTLQRDALAYQYRYDTKGRLVGKKLPGKGWEFMIYDKQDRLVGSQDAVLSAKGQWLYTQYDQFGRVVITGIATGGDRSTEQVLADGSGNMTRTGSVVFNRQGMDVYYDPGVTYPHASKWVALLSVTYYDSYPAYSFNPAFPSAIQGEPVLSETLTSDGRSTKGLPVISVVKNIEDDSWTKNYSYYDKKGRVIGSHSINHLGGYTHKESKLDFAGVTKQTVTKHKRLTTDTERVITETFDYDNQNRLLVHKHQIDSNPIEILTQNTYNEISQITNKKVGGTDLANSLQSIDYKYNIRGWLTKINDPATLNGKLFGYEIKYTNPGYTNLASGRYNGNIAEVDWRNASEGALKRYSYTYDPLNRLKDAIYTEPGATNPYNNNFNENLTYDLNGNIMTLKRNAYPVSGTTATQVDDLEYKYTGNRLNQVIEHSSNTSGYEGGNNIIAYDLNGSMTDMKDKGIQSIAYNHLSLPNAISIQSFDYMDRPINTGISHLYRADGVKLRKTVSQQFYMGLPTNRMTDYLDDFHYSFEDNGGICLTCKTENAFEVQAYSKKPPILPTAQWKLEFVPTSEGFYSFVENRYIYNYKDHLGNVRITFAKNNAGVLETIDTNNYYPFGLNHIGGSSSSNFGGYYNYKFGGKELQETGWSDFGARMYISDLGRWGVVDPLAEKMRRWSPYNYAFDNPMRFVDPDGRAPMDEFDKNGRKISSLGGNKIDFFHQENGDTKIVNRQDGSSNTIRGGESIIRDYEQRSKEIGWYFGITTEFLSGNGPTYSMFSDFNNSNYGPFASLDKMSSAYSSLARKDVLNSKNSRGRVKMNYGGANPIAAGLDGWEQMWGRSNISWYKLGNTTLFLMTDSKSDESLYYRVANSHERGEGYGSYPHGNTYQTYIWTETTSEIKSKTIELNTRRENNNQKLQQQRENSIDIIQPKF